MAHEPCEVCGGERAPLSKRTVCRDCMRILWRVHSGRMVALRRDEYEALASRPFVVAHDADPAELERLADWLRGHVEGQHI